MSGKLTLSAQHDQRLLMNQKLRQMITFLQYTTIELKEKIQELLDNNPLVEVKEEQETDLSENSLPEWMTYTPATRHISYNDDQDDYLQNISSVKTLRDHLIEQTLNCHFTDIEQEVAEMLIDMIDEDGFITVKREEILDLINKKISTATPLESGKLNSILETIKSFEPAGIAASNLQECLLLQLNAKKDGSKVFEDAEKIILADALGQDSVNFKVLQKHIGITQAELSEALCLINSLDFHPGKSFSTSTSNVNEPEVYVKKIGDKWQAFLVDSILTKVEINNTYKEIIKQNTRDKAYKSILNLLQEASYLLAGIKRRNETLLRVASYIVERQQDFLESGAAYLQPITLREVAESLELHESTISRITTEKYIATPHGIFELKYFFPSHVATVNGQSKSSTAVKEMIKEIISTETPESSYSDEDIAKILNEKGINVSRRTVTKYRESMNIATSYLRHSAQELSDN